MKITFNNYKNITYSSRNKKIRTADDILRHSKKNFPMVSSTYIDTFYKESTPEKNTLSQNVCKRFSKKIEQTRDIYLSHIPHRYMSDLKSHDTEVANGVLLKAVSQSKMGNCYESAVASLACLAANGFTDSKKVHLYLTTECHDKETNEKVFRNMTDLDHVFVISSMGKKSNKLKDLVVVDPWLGFTDSVSGANARFKQVFSQEYTNARNKHERLFNAEMSEKEKSLNRDDYLIRHYFSYVCLDSLTSSEIERMGEYARKEFEGVIKKL